MLRPTGCEPDTYGCLVSSCDFPHASSVAEMVIASQPGTRRLGYRPVRVFAGGDTKYGACRIGNDGRRASRVGLGWYSEPDIGRRTIIVAPAALTIGEECGIAIRDYESQPPPTIIAGYLPSSPS